MESRAHCIAIPTSMIVGFDYEDRALLALGGLAGGWLGCRFCGIRSAASGSEK